MKKKQRQQPKEEPFLIVNDDGIRLLGFSVLYQAVSNLYRIEKIRWVNKLSIGICSASPEDEIERRSCISFFRWGGFDFYASLTGLQIDTKTTFKKVMKKAKEDAERIVGKKEVPGVDETTGTT